MNSIAWWERVADQYHAPQRDNLLSNLQQGMDHLFSVAPLTMDKLRIWMAIILLSFASCSSPDYSLYPPEQAEAIEIITKNKEGLIKSMWMQMKHEACSKKDAIARWKARAPLRIGPEEIVELALIFGVGVQDGMPVTRNDSQHATVWVWSQENNPWNKGTRRVWRPGWKKKKKSEYKDFSTLRDGFAAVFEELDFRRREYMRMFPWENPTFRELLENRSRKGLFYNGYEHVGFMSNQVNYGKPNPAFDISAQGDTTYQIRYGRYMEHRPWPTNAIKAQKERKKKRLMTPYRNDPLDLEPWSFTLLEIPYLWESDYDYYRYQVGKQKVLVGHVKWLIQQRYQKEHGLKPEKNEIDVLGYPYRNTQIGKGRCPIIAVKKKKFLKK